MLQKLLFAVGGCLLMLGLLGPFTYADDFRHVGEMAAALGLALAGLCMLLPQLPVEFRCKKYGPLVSVMFLLGLGVGTVFDHSLAGLIVGAVFGVAVSAWLCTHQR